jgi:hypothetical protein
VPAAKPRRGYHVHDGFYLRLGAGVGGGAASVSTNRNSSPNFELGGAGLAGNLWVGGTPWSGVAIGGLLSFQGMGDGDVRVEGDGSGEGMNGSMALLGLFIDAFPDPLRGLHFGGAVGLAGIGGRSESHALEDDHGVADLEAGGLGASAWVGYMGFVGPQWSLGGMLQLTGAATAQEQDGVTRRASGGALSLSFTALYH